MDGIKGKGKGKGGNANTGVTSEAKGGGKGKKGKGGNPGTGPKTPDKPQTQSGKVTITFSRNHLETDAIQKCRAEVSAMEGIYAKDSHAAQNARGRLSQLLHQRDEGKTPSQKATDKRRQLKDARKKLGRAAHNLDTAEATLAAAQADFEAAKSKLEDMVVYTDRLEEELQYYEEQYLRPQATPGAQRDLVLERAQDARDRAMLGSGGQDAARAELQQLTNRIDAIMEDIASEPRKKTRTRWDDPDDLPPVPEEGGDKAEASARLGPDVVEVDMEETDTHGEASTTSQRILAKMASSTTRSIVLAKGQGKGVKGDQKPPTPPWATGPTPAEANAKAKKPGLQSPAGGEAEHMAQPAREEAPDPPASSRNQGGDGLPSGPPIPPPAQYT
jgi:hypothetical protein